MKTKVLTILTICMMVTAGLYAQGQVFVPDTPEMEFPGEIIQPNNVVADTVSTEEPHQSPTLIKREWKKLEPQLKNVVLTITLLDDSEIIKDVNEISYLYEISGAPCYGVIWLCMSEKTPYLRYQVSSTNPLNDGITPCEISKNGCKSGNDDGSLQAPSSIVIRQFKKK